MRHLRYLVLLAGLVVPTAYSQAQVSIGVRIGPTYGLYNAPPVCEYGFYPDYPFACAPYGYWGPEWFVDGVFIGAGPWNHFYYTHAGFYRPFYVNRGFGGYGFRGRVETFHGRRDFDRDRGFRERGREFHDNDRRGFNDGRRFRDGGEHTFRGGDGPSGRGGRQFRGGSGGGDHGGGRGEHGDGGHGGRR